MGQGYLQKCRKLKAGDVFRIEHLREIIEAVDASRPIGGVDVYTRETAGGVVLSAVGRKGSSSVDPTDREFQIKFLDMETKELYPSRNPGDKKVPIVFGGRVYGKNAESMVWCGPEEDWDLMISPELYVVINVDTKGGITGAAFVPNAGADKPWKPGEIGVYYIKVGKIRNDGSVYQMLQGPIELPLSGDEKKEDVHEFKISIQKRKTDNEDGNAGGGDQSGPSSQEGDVYVYWGRILKADYSTYDVGAKKSWNKVPESNARNSKIYVHYDVSMEGKITKYEFKTKEREIKEFYPHDVHYSGGQEGKYCILIGEIIDGEIIQNIHGPIPFLSRVGRTNDMITAYKCVDGQFLDFWPLLGDVGIDVDFEKSKDEETGKEKIDGVKYKLKLVADNAGIIINKPAKKKNHEEYIGLETVSTTPFSVQARKKEAPPLFPGDVEYEVTVKANNGSVAYFNSDNDEFLSFWYAEDKTFEGLMEGYITLECNVKTKQFEIKEYYSAMPRWEWDGDGKPSISRCVLARVFDGHVFQFTFFSFILSPMFLGKNAVLDLSPYASWPD